MPQDVADGFQRSSTLQEMDGVRVTQTMWALVGNAEPAFADQSLKGLRDRGGFQYAHGSAHSEEDSAVRRRRRGSLQMLYQRRHNLIGERQFQRRGGLTLMDTQDALPPADVLQADGNHLAGA